MSLEKCCSLSGNLFIILFIFFSSESSMWYNLFKSELLKMFILTGVWTDMIIEQTFGGLRK